MLVGLGSDAPAGASGSDEVVMMVDCAIVATVTMPGDHCSCQNPSCQ